MTHKTFDRRFTDRRDKGLARAAFGRFSTVADHCTWAPESPKRGLFGPRFLKLTLFVAALSVLLFSVPAASSSYTVSVCEFTEHDGAGEEYAVAVELGGSGGSPSEYTPEDVVGLITESLSESFDNFLSAKALLTEDSAGNEEFTYVAFFSEETDLAAIKAALLASLEGDDAPWSGGSSNGEEFTES